MDHNGEVTWPRSLAIFGVSCLGVLAGCASSPVHLGSPKASPVVGLPVPSNSRVIVAGSVKNPGGSVTTASYAVPNGVDIRTLNRWYRQHFIPVGQAWRGWTSCPGLASDAFTSKLNGGGTSWGWYRGTSSLLLTLSGANGQVQILMSEHSLPGSVGPSGKSPGFPFCPGSYTAQGTGGHVAFTPP